MSAGATILDSKMILLRRSKKSQLGTQESRMTIAELVVGIVDAVGATPVGDAATVLAIGVVVWAIGAIIIRIWP